MTAHLKSNKQNQNEVEKKKPSKRLALLLMKRNKLLIKSCSHAVTIVTACCHFPPRAHTSLGFTVAGGKL